MDDFISVKNFKHLFKLLNIYSEQKYNIKLNFKNFKKIIGNSMYEINDNFGDKLTTKKKNILIIKILKQIIDEKQQVDNFFEVEDNNFKSNQTLETDNLYNINNYDLQKKEEIEEKKEENILEKRLENEKKVYEKIINNTTSLDTNIKQKNDMEKYMREMMLEKPIKKKVDMNENIKNINQDVLISPEEYKKTINKYIKKVDILIDSRDRNYDEYDSNNYILDLHKEINNVFSIELIYGIIPKSEYIVNLNNNILYVEEVSGNVIQVEIPVGNYTKIELASEIETALNNNINLSSTYRVITENVSIILNRIETDDSNFINYTGINVEYIFNNNINQYWTTDLGVDNPSFFIYDFKRDVLIKEYSFISKNLNRPKDFSLEISKDGINWITLQNVINQATSSNRYKTYSFINNNYYSRYVRFTITNSSGGNNVPVGINNMNFVTYSDNKIQIESDLTANEQNYFNLLFFGGTNVYNGKSISYYKDRSIGPLIGFLPTDRTDLGFYSSDNDIILKNDKVLKIYVNDEEFYIELESNSGEYTYQKQLDIVKFLDKLENIKKLNIQFKNTNNIFYNFNGLEHCLYLRLYHYNTNQVFRDSL